MFVPATVVWIGRFAISVVAAVFGTVAFAFVQFLTTGDDGFALLLGEVGQRW